jgi:hypothetical protein
MANPGIEAKALWALATVTLAAGDHGMAREHFTVGVAASRSAELKLWEARLLLGRAAAEQAAGSTTAASADLDAAEAAFPTPRPARDARRVRELRAALDA